MTARRFLHVALVFIWAAAAGAADVPVIASGDRVDVKDHLAVGRLTLFDFYADWCGGCRQLEPHIHRYAAGFPERLAVRKIDIVRWDSPVAEQYGLNSIPHLKLYDERGQLGERLERLPLPRVEWSLPGRGNLENR